ncbi:MAG: ISL3 family transposase [Gaiellaceae bacterium]
MRVTTAFNRMLAIPGASVRSVSLEPAGVLVGLRLRRRRLVCGRCGCLGRGGYDRRRRRWRHLDLAGRRCWLECELRRFACPGCRRIVSEAVPWARAGARHTRAFDQLVACLARQMAKTPLAELLRVSWTTVGRIIERTLEDTMSEQRLEGLRRIGIDEVSFRRGHRYLTLVVDHDSGHIVWASEGARAKESLDSFLDALGPERASRIEAVSIDMAPGYYQALRERLPAAALCIDPFHVVRLANHALNLVRRGEWNRQGRSKTGAGRWLMGTRWALVTAPERHSERQRSLLAELEQTNRSLYSAYLLKEQLRGLYRLPDPEQAPPLFDLWLHAARTSGLASFQRLAGSLSRFRDSILAAIKLGLSNGRLEGLNAKVRLLTHRSFGFHSAKPLIALVYLCCGGIQTPLPLR